MEYEYEEKSAASSKNFQGGALPLSLDMFSYSTLLHPLRSALLTVRYCEIPLKVSITNISHLPMCGCVRVFPLIHAVVSTGGSLQREFFALDSGYGKYTFHPYVSLRTPFPTDPSNLITAIYL